MAVTRQDIWLLLTDCHRSHGILPIRRRGARWQNSFCHLSTIIMPIRQEGARWQM